MTARGAAHGAAPLRAATSEAARQRTFRSYFSARPSAAAEVLYVAPLYLLYQVLAFLTPARNGVDFVTTLLLRVRGLSVELFLGVVAVLVVGVVWIYVRARRQERFGYRLIRPVLLESAAYALVMGSLILLVMRYLLGMRPPSLGAEGMGGLEIVYVSAGAGVHEELVFRVLIYGLLLSVLGSLVAPRRWVTRFLVIALALGASAALFSISHHAPPHGEPYTQFAFVYRLLAGGLFGLMYHYRGFAVAVYAHFLYDVLVLSLGR